MTGCRTTILRHRPGIFDVFARAGMTLRHVFSAALIVAASPSWGDDQMVLWGTDVRELSEFDIIAVPDDLTGPYRVELGGAEVTLEVAAAEDGWTVTRTYKAPGAEADVAQYMAVWQDGVLKDTCGRLEIRAISDALIVQEVTDTDIPAGGLWLVYEPG